MQLKFTIRANNLRWCASNLLNNVNTLCTISSHSFCFVWDDAKARPYILAAARENRSNKQRVEESLGPVARNWSCVFKMHHEVEAHRNYRESVSWISRALARHVRGPSRLSDYLNTTTCMRWRGGAVRSHVTDEIYSQSDSSRPMASRCSTGRRWLFNSLVLDTSVWLL